MEKKNGYNSKNQNIASNPYLLTYFGEIPVEIKKFINRIKLENKVKLLTWRILWMYLGIEEQENFDYINSSKVFTDSFHVIFLILFENHLLLVKGLVRHHQ